MKLTPRDQILVNNLKVKNSNFTGFEHPGFFLLSVLQTYMYLWGHCYDYCDW